MPDAIVVMAHRDNTGAGPGANDNASGTAALVELARVLTLGNGRRAARRTRSSSSPPTRGTAGGARRRALRADVPGPIAAVINLDGIAGPGRPRIVIAGDQPRSPPLTLVATAAARIHDADRPRPGADARASAS